MVSPEFGDRQPANLHVAVLLRQVGERVVRVRIVENEVEPHGIFLVPQRKLDMATGEATFIGYKRVPVEIVPVGFVETSVSDGELARQWLGSFTPVGTRKDPALSF